MTVDFFAAAKAAAERRAALLGALEPHRLDRERYLRMLWAGADPRSASVYIGPKSGHTPAPRHLPLRHDVEGPGQGPWAGLSDIVSCLALDGDVYVALAPNRLDAAVSGQRHGKAIEKTGVGVLWADFDVGSAKRRPSEPNHVPFFTSIEHAVDFARALPLPPTALVASGAGLHAYWGLDRHHPVAEVSAVVSALQQDLQRRARALPRPAYGPDFVPQATMILRPPGSLNWKRAKDGRAPEVVRLLALTEDRYSLAALGAQWPTASPRSLAPSPARVDEMTPTDTLQAMRAAVLRTTTWEHRGAALRFLGGQSWAAPGEQDIVLIRIAWFLCRACGWRPSTDTVEELCEVAAENVENSHGDRWTVEQIFQRFESAARRGLQDAASAKRMVEALSGARTTIERGGVQ